MVADPEKEQSQFLLARAHSAVVIQLGGVIVLIFGSLPYFIFRKGVEDWVVKMMASFFILHGIIAVGIFRACKLHLIWQRGGSVPVDKIKVDDAINAMALVNLLPLFALIVFTGGITYSSFVSLLLLVPVLAVLLKASLIGWIVSISNFLFIALVLVKIPIVATTILDYLGRYNCLLTQIQWVLRMRFRQF